MIPEAKAFYFESGLFSQFEFYEKEKIALFHLLFYKGTIDAHCPHCKKETVLESIDNYLAEDFTGKPIKLANELVFKAYSNFNFLQKEFKCPRCSNIHRFYFEITFSKSEMSKVFLKKIGQRFSIADYQNHDIKKYRTVLGKELYNEFSKGVGLFSHGVGIGSFVYLRRIIEKFILNEAYIKEANNPSFDKDLFERSRVKEKIDLLKSSLPDFLVSNKSLYGILSKGIHELSEQECLKIFPVLKTSIEYILDEIKAKKELEEKKKKLTGQINKINEQLTKESKPPTK